MAVNDTKPMSVIENQEHLINQAQFLYEELFLSGKYSEAIAIGKLILDLSIALKELSVIYPAIAKSPTSKVIRWSDSPFGQPNLDNINYAENDVTALRQVRVERSKPNQFSDVPPQPSQYAWADGFQGVTVPPREIDAPPLPNPNNVSSQPRPDYWEDARRQQ